MARGKYLSLEEARKGGKIDRFAKEHPSKGDKSLFFRLLDALGGPKRSKADEQTSTRDASACCTETQTRRDT